MISATRSPLRLSGTMPRFAAAGVIEYLGVVNYATNERVLAEIKRRVVAQEDITLMVTSAGGPSGTAMSFYDTVRSVLAAELTTVGAGDVDSSGMLIFLSGTRRFVTPHTTALLHPAGRSFAAGVRYTAAEMRAMLTEDERKDALYASIVAQASGGCLTEEKVLTLMKEQTVLCAADFVRYGLAGSVL